MPAELEHHGPCCVLTLRRPEVHNALDRDLVREMAAALERVAEDRDCRVLILTGAGQAFCSGADVRHMHSLEDEAELQRFLVETRRLFRRLAEMAIPTVAAVNGHAHGGGAELACTCDLRLGSERATFRFPGLAYGMAVGTWHLPTVVGLPKAKELLLTSETIDAEESLRIGLLNRLYRSEELIDAARALSERIASHPPEATAMVKHLLDRAVGAPLQQRFFREIYSNRELGSAVPSRSGLRRFLDRSG